MNDEPVVPKYTHNGHRSPKIQIERKRHEVFVIWSWSLRLTYVESSQDSLR